MRVLTCPASVASTVSGVSSLQSILHNCHKLTNLTAYTASKMLGQLQRKNKIYKSDMITYTGMKRGYYCNSGNAMND